MLQELDIILDRQPTDQAREALERDMQSLSRVLLEKQFLFADDYHNQKRFEIARVHRKYFENLFEALGYKFLFDERERLVGIMNMAGAAGRPMKLRHALFLLALRVIYQENIRTFNLQQGGRCKTTMAEVWALIEERARGLRRPSPRQCEDIARDFQRNGIVRIGEGAALDGDLELEIRPVIRLVVSEATAQGLERYATEQRQEADNTPGDAQETADHTTAETEQTDEEGDE